MFSSKLLSHLLGALTVFFLLTSACNLPSLLSTPTPTPTRTPKSKPFSGLRVVLEPDVPAGTSIEPEALGTTFNVLQSRLKGLGINAWVTKPSGDRQIIVEIPSGQNADSILSTLQQTGLVEFVDMSTTSTPPTSGTIIVTDFGSVNTSGQDQVWHTILTGKDIDSAEVKKDSLGKYGVAFQFNKESQVVFAEYTSQHTGKYLAIVIDKKIISVPMINNTIPDGKGMIAGSFTQETAKQLAVWIRSKPLPFPLKVVESTIVNPDE